MESKHGGKASVEPIVESFGYCLNHSNCHSYNVVLGDGLCMRCWDVGWRPKSDRSEHQCRKCREINLKTLKKLDERTQQ